MHLTGLHLLLTYQCNYSCDHCFVWGGPQQRSVMTAEQIRTILRQAVDLPSVEWIYFEGGEPFLYYPVLLRGLQLATSMGFRAGVVTNAYWATSEEDAITWLRPLASLLNDLSISLDDYHGSASRVQAAIAAAEKLDLPVNVLRVARPEAAAVDPDGASPLMYRGRAAKILAPKAAHIPANQCTACAYEDFKNPQRVHIDPFGHVHLCQGISMGNVFENPLKELMTLYAPERHPIAGALLRGGPYELAKAYDLKTQKTYADACHLCYDMRLKLRAEFPHALAPAAVYGE